MTMSKNKNIQIDGKEISIITNDKVDFITLTDISRSQMHEKVIIKYLSLKSSIEYFGEWEMLYNPIFNSTEFGRIKNLVGSNNFALSE